jgi:hypothetical protein
VGISLYLWKAEVEMTDLNWLERAVSEYEPQQDTGYDHPEEVFFPEIVLPQKAREEDYEFPSVKEDTVREESDWITTTIHKWRNGIETIIHESRPRRK